MARRGPKARTATNTRHGHAGGLWDGFRLPSDEGDDVIAHYRRLIEVLDKIGTRQKIDPMMVVNAARSLAMLDKANKVVLDQGLTAVGGHGSPIPHPLLAVINSLTLRVRGMMNDFGLTAASAKLASPASSSDNETPWAGLLNVHSAG